MQCPNPSCHSENPKPELVMSERSGIEIDYCPRCRGIWLDRGELDKLLEKAAKESEPSAPPLRNDPVQPQRDPHYDNRPRYEDKSAYKKYDDDKYKHSGSYKYKKKSLLSELFDF